MKLKMIHEKFHLRRQPFHHQVNEDQQADLLQVEKNFQKVQNSKYIIKCLFYTHLSIEFCDHHYSFRRFHKILKIE